MSGKGTIICRACGFANHEGDQFCGSCGGFLEWEGAAAPSRAVADEPAVGGHRTSGEVPPDESPARATPVDLVRCAACGIANPPTRTFCQSCGERLAKAPAAASRGAATPAQPPTPSVPSTRQAPPARERGRTTAAATGVPRWLLAVAVLGLVVGAGAFIGMTLLRGDTNVAPAARVTASSALAANPARSAVDGTTEHWNAAGVAPQWIEFRLDRPTSITAITLEVAQDPAGRSIHEIWLQRTGGASKLVTSFDGVTFDGDLLEFLPEVRIDDVEVVRIVTTRVGDLFPAWREIEIIGRPA